MLHHLINEAEIVNQPRTGGWFSVFMCVCLCVFLCVCVYMCVLMCGCGDGGFCFGGCCEVVLGVWLCCCVCGVVWCGRVGVRGCVCVAERRERENKRER